MPTRYGSPDATIRTLPHRQPPVNRSMLSPLSADLLGQLDDNSLRAAEVAEPIAVFVALHLANELRAAGLQASDDSVDVVDCECDMADAGGVRRRVPVAAPARRGVKPRQLEPSVTVPGFPPSRSPPGRP